MATPSFAEGIYQKYQTADLVFTGKVIHQEILPSNPQQTLYQVEVLESIKGETKSKLSFLLAKLFKEDKSQLNSDEQVFLLSALPHYSIYQEARHKGAEFILKDKHVLPSSSASFLKAYQDALQSDDLKNFIFTQKKISGLELEFLTDLLKKRTDLLFILNQKDLAFFFDLLKTKTTDNILSNWIQAIGFHPQSGPYLKNLIKTDHGHIQRSALLALHALGEELKIEEYNKIYRDNKDRLKTLTAISSSKNVDLVPLFKQIILAPENAEVKLAAYQYWYKRNSHQVLAFAKERLKFSDLFALEFLTSLEDDSALQFAIQHLQTQDLSLKKASVNVILRMQSPNAVQARKKYLGFTLSNQPKHTFGHEH